MEKKMNVKFFKSEEAGKKIFTIVSEKEILKREVAEQMFREEVKNINLGKDGFTSYSIIESIPSRTFKFVVY